jgi:hypothetical protein
MQDDEKTFVWQEVLNLQCRDVYDSMTQRLSAVIAQS